MARLSLRPKQPGDLGLIMAVNSFLERHFGPIKTIYHDEDPGVVHVDVDHVLPSEKYPFHTLMTSGMAEKPMTLPKGMKRLWAFCELVMHLDPAWPGWDTGEGIETFYPIAALRQLASFPHENQTWLGPGHSTDLEFDEGNPLHVFSGFVLLPGTMAGPHSQFLRSDFRRINVCTIAPVYSAELELKRKSGMVALKDAAIAAGISIEDLSVIRFDRQPIVGA